MIVNVEEKHFILNCVFLKVLVEKSLLGKEIFSIPFTLAFRKSGRILLRNVKTWQMLKKYAEVKVSGSNSVSAKTGYI